MLKFLRTKEFDIWLSSIIVRAKKLWADIQRSNKMVELREFDAAEYLENDEAIAMFLAEAAKDENPDVFLSALSVAARARGITEIAKKTGLGRTSLYKALAPGANPSYLTLRKVMSALGVHFSATTDHPHHSAHA
ncbi:hypothetical protein GCM10027288_48870 [Bordetella tumbae]|uniref:addiction module antidote protein n=2 Tax=Bordetella TaxID=517 RepID=UPI0039EE4E02